MKRLTETRGGVTVYTGPWCEYETGMIPAELRPDHVRQVLNRLASYEDTGLEPEEVSFLVAANDADAAKLAEYREKERKRAPKCYEEDIGGGCRYQVPDGDDEPLDKCKRCPLCYVDKQRHHAPPNDPLTLEELRGMGGGPVWVVELNGYPPRWALVHWSPARKTVFLLFDNSAMIRAEAHIHAGGRIYRRRPEEGRT